MSVITITAILGFGNLILSSANVIIGFSLFVYILTHNFRSPVARAFCALMALVTGAYIADVGLADVQSATAANIWLRFQWIGIAFVPAAYFHFADAVLRTTGSASRIRRLGVLSGYLVGLVAFVAAAFSGLIVNGVGQQEQIYHLLPGPFFWVFALYYALATMGGWVNIRRARARCLTSTSRRRMSYLMWAFAAPSIGVFPFLLVPAAAQHLSASLVSVLALFGNVGIAMMAIVIGYSVAYQGVLLPDRVVKHSLIHFLLRGPLVGILVIVVMLTIPRVEHILGLPRDTVLIVSVAGSLVILQLLISVAKPAIDRLIYRKDRQEIAWIQTLDQRLLTSTDLEQLLENTLLALCDLLRVPSGFIVTVQGSTFSLRVFCGHRESAVEYLSRVSPPEILDALSRSRQDEGPREANGARNGNGTRNQDFVLADSHWLLPLRGRKDKAILGTLGIPALGPMPTFREDDLESMDALVRRAELALEDIRLQQQVFAVLLGLGNELDQLQEWRSIPRYVGAGTAQDLAMALAQSPGFSQVVKDALSQFWGGPKLSQSPLLRLRIVHDKLGGYDHVPAKAVRAVLQEALERLKPNGGRSMTAGEWMVYNILDLKFVQGQRTRDIARRLAMSESDFYRKQRIAVEQMAQTLMQMEQAREE